MISIILHLTLALAAAALAPVSLYLVAVTLAAVGLYRRPPDRDDSMTIAVVIPAHNEASLMAATLKRILQSNYARDQFTVYVIADNCTDNTADIARLNGAAVFERHDPDRRGKGQALDWLFRQHRDILERHEATVIVDADARVDPNFLGVMAAHMRRPDIAAVQCNNRVANPEANWRTALTYAGFALMNCVRLAGRSRLHGSTELKGNGMAFRSEILLAHGWPAQSVVEDIEFGIRLLMDGERVVFEPQAYVESDMPASRRVADAQRRRWEVGRAALARRMAPKLLVRAWTRGSWSCFLAALDLMVPPLSLLVLAQAAALVLAAIAGPGWVAIFGIFAGCTIFHVIGGLLVCRAPRKVWLALAAAPLFLTWKVLLYARVAVTPRQKEWVRTARPGEEDSAQRTACGRR